MFSYAVLYCSSISREQQIYISAADLFITLIDIFSLFCKSGSRTHHDYSSSQTASAIRGRIEAAKKKKISHPILQQTALTNNTSHARIYVRVGLNDKSVLKL